MSPQKKPKIKKETDKEILDKENLKFQIEKKPDIVTANTSNNKSGGLPPHIASLLGVKDKPELKEKMKKAMISKV